MDRTLFELEEEAMGVIKRIEIHQGSSARERARSLVRVKRAALDALTCLSEMWSKENREDENG